MTKPSLPRAVAAALLLAVALGVPASALAQDQDAFVSLHTGREVLVFDPSSPGDVTIRVALFGRPTGLVVSEDGSTVYVLSDANIRALRKNPSTGNFELGPRAFLNGSPEQIALTPDGSTLWVPNMFQQIWYADAGLTAAGKFFVPGNARAFGVAMTTNADGLERAYVSLPDLNVIQVYDVSVPPSASALVATIPLPAGVTDPRGVAASVQGDRVYVASSSGHITVIDTDESISPVSDRVIGTIDVGDSPQNVTVSADGMTLYATLPGAGTIAPINALTFAVGTPVPVHSDPTPNVDQLHGLAINENGFVVTAHSGTHLVSALDTATGIVQHSPPLATFPSTSTPRYVAFRPPTDAPPAFGPAAPCGDNLIAGVGSPLGFMVSADDDRWLTLEVDALPGSSTLTEPLPQTDYRSVMSSFSWTPTSGDVGNHQISFTATDSSGQQATCVVGVDVTIPDTPPSLLSIPDVFGAPLTPALGDTVSFTVNAADETEVTLSVTGLPAGATLSPALPLHGTDVSSDFSWPIVGVAAGTYEVTFSAADATHAPVSGTVTVVVPEPDAVEFAAFRLRAAKIVTRGYFADSFLFHGYFNVDRENGDDIDPPNEDVTINIEGTEWTIPAGEFQSRLRGRVFRFRGIVDGTKLFVYITQRGRRGGRYNLSVIGWNGSFEDPQNPLRMCVTVGDDFGCAEKGGWIR